MTEQLIRPASHGGTVSSIITDFLSQSVQYQQRTGSDVTGEPTYGPAQPLAARVERRHVRIMTADGPLLSNITYVLVEERINTEDRFDTGDGQGWREVESVEDVISSEGEFWGTECYM